jgi:two-component system alkaline phosphatase synthesis response regulator PhoP
MAKILLIEDTEIMIELLERKLVQEGYEVLVARDGEEGLRLMRENWPNLILLDIILPKMGGFEVLKEMNQNPSLKKIPVIIISNSGQQVELSKAIRLGVKDWLIKTEFEPQELINKVVKQIGR